MAQPLIHPNQQLLLDRQFRPSETVKLTLTATLLRSKGKGAVKAGDGADADLEESQEEQRVIVGVVSSGGAESGREEGEEEGAIFLLLPTSPSTLQILHLLPIVTTTSLGISQRSSIPLTPGQTYAEFQANHDIYHPSGLPTTAKPRQEKASVEYVVTFRKEGAEGEKVEVGVKEIGEVEGLLREVKRLKAIKEECEKGPGRWRRGGKGHGWTHYYSRTTPTTEVEKRAFKPSPIAGSTNGSPSFEFTPAPTSAYLLSKLRETYIRSSLFAQHSTWTTQLPLRLHVATFNVNDSLPPAGVSLAPLVDDKADILAFGFQELDLSVASLVFAPGGEGQTGKTREEVWTERLLEGLGEERKGEFEKLTSKQFVGVLIIVLVRKDVRPFIGDVATDAVPVGLMGLMGNKAGVAVRMRVHGTYITFVVAHLAAFADQVEKRRLDYEEITKRLKFPYIPSEASKSVTHYGHEELATGEEPIVSIPSPAAGLVFWAGDLNYRVDLPDEQGWTLIANKDVKALLLKDQLNHERAVAKRVFQGFEEGEIRFPPTFKFERGTHNYDPKRLPAWCDRVLFRPTEHDSVELLAYTSHPEISFSDHQPVSATFEVHVRKIDHQRWKDLQDQLGREADKLENDAVPTLEVSDLNIDFGTVGYQQPLVRSLTLTNTRSQPAHFSFHPSEPSLSPSFNFSPSSTNASAPASNRNQLTRPWMWVHPSTGVVLPGQTETVHFSLLVDGESAGALNTGEEAIEDVLILRVENGNDTFISIEGTYLPTPLHLPLDLLVRLPCPIRSIPRSSSQDFFENLLPLENSLSLPREIWRLVDWLMSDLESPSSGSGSGSGAGGDRLFLEGWKEGDDEGMREWVLEALATGAPFSPLPPHLSSPVPTASLSNAISSTLLLLLFSLPEPVVPYGRSQATCASSATSKDDAFQILDTLPNVSANTVIYLTSFLRWYLEKVESGGAGAKGQGKGRRKVVGKELAVLFAQILLRDRPGEKGVDMAAKTRWVEYLLEG